MEKNNQIVISLGGSLIVPDEIDVDFLNSFIKTIKEYVAQGFKFVIVTGGGKVCRRYNDSLKKIVSPSNEDLDWLGISATRLNAEFVRICFGDLAYEKIILDPDMIPKTDKLIMIGGGWKPGNSSDLAAIRCAKSIGAKKMINLCDTNLYDSDPKKNPEAKKIEKISWTDFRALVPKEWVPGLNFPFDPIAAKEAEESMIEVVIMNGKPIDNLTKCLNGESFQGTVIKNL